ncbi:hypothetical protein FACS1894151_07500 [Spirochaetia bacterium]|nr:hypothetical protein FACS1894151_07500 [Spirochaetia bacterium]
MSRIRNVKPEFFRHEGLQDLERNNIGKYPMFVFEGLWTKCDRQGVFEWKPRSLKLDILPFLDFDMEETLGILEAAGYITKYLVNNKEYGFIPTFKKHQVVSRAEQNNVNVFPLPPKNPEHIQEDSRPIMKPIETSDTGLETDDEPFPNSSKTVFEQLQNTGSLNSEFGKLNSENGNSEIHIPDSENQKVCDFKNNPQKLFLHLWQNTPDVFNCTARIESPNDFDRFWEANKGITCEMVSVAVENFAAGIREGAIERRFIPAFPDRFVLKNGIQRYQERFKKKDNNARAGPPPKHRIESDNIDTSKDGWKDYFKGDVE